MRWNGLGLVMALGLVGLAACGGPRAFRVTHRHGPWVARGTTGEVAILDDGTDAAHGLLARAIAGRLSAVLPTRVMPSAADGRTRGILTLQLRRDTRLESSGAQSSSYTQSPDGRFTSETPTMSSTSTTVVYDVNLHLALADMGTRTSELHASHSAADATAAERVVRDEIARLVVLSLTSVEEVVSLEVGEIHGGALEHAVDAAVDHLDGEHCAAIATIASSTAPGRERSVALFATGRCEHALAIARSSAGGLDREALERAIAFYEAAMGEQRDRRYRDALIAASRLHDELE